MALLLLAVPVYATDGAQTEDGEKPPVGLYISNVNYDNEKGAYSAGNHQKEMELPLGEDWWVMLEYYDGVAYQPLSAFNVTLTPDNSVFTIESANENSAFAGYTLLRASGVGEAQIVYVVGEGDERVEYSVKLRSLLPEIGFYSGTSTETYIEQFTLTDLNKELYVLLAHAPEFNGELNAFYIHNDEPVFSDAVTLSEVTNYGTEAAPLYGAKITLDKDGDLPENFELIVEWAYTDGCAGTDIHVTNSRPQLLYKRVNIINNVPTPVEPYDHRVNLTPNGSLRLKLELQDGENTRTIPASEVTLEQSGNVFSIETLEHNGTSYDQMCHLYANGIGEAQLVYKDGEKEYRIPVRSELPAIGFYSAPTVSVDTLLTEFRVTEDNSGVFYLLLTRDQLVNPTHKIEHGEEYVDSCEFKNFGTEEKPVYGVKIKLKDEFPAEFDLNVRIDADNWNNNRGIRVKDNRPGLVYSIADMMYGVPQENPNRQKEKVYDYPIGARYVCFYLSDADGNYQRIDDGITLVQEKNASTLEKTQTKGVWKLNAMGAGQFVYTTGGKTYKLALNPVLPEVGLYTAATPSASAYVDNGRVFTMDGQSESLWLSCKNPQIIQTISVGVIDSLKGSTTTTVIYGSGADEASNPSLPAWLSMDQTGAPGSFKFTIDSQKFSGRYEFVFFVNFGNGGQNLSFDVSEPAYAVTDMPTFEYEGKKYAISLAKLWHSGLGEVLNLRLPGTGESDGNINPDGSTNERVWTEFVGIMQDYGIASVTEAFDMYQYVTGLECEIGTFTNADGSDECFLSITDSTFERGGVNVPAVEFRAGSYGFAVIQTKITLDLPDQDPMVFQLYSTFKKHGAVQSFELDLSKNVDGYGPIDTTEKLNAILASSEAFDRYYAANDPDKVEAYQWCKNPANMMSHNVDLKLPPVTYEGIIYAQYNGIKLIGTEDASGNRTTVSGGIVVKNHLNDIQNISFVANEQYKVTYENDTFTCGILADGGNTTAHRCSFENYEYGMRSTRSGSIIPKDLCYFKNNAVGAYLENMDSADFGHSVFEGNTTAIILVSLRQNTAPYYFRIGGCDFIDNQHDFDVNVPEGTYWFLGNFFGETKDGEIVYRKANNIVRGSGRVITDPRWGSPNCEVVNGRVQPRDDDENRKLLADNKNVPMLNELASQYKFSEDAVTMNDGLSVSVEDKNGKVLGYWTIN